VEGAHEGASKRPKQPKGVPLPDGWTEQVHHASARSYPTFHGPNGEKVYSRVQAVRMHAAKGGDGSSPPAATSQPLETGALKRPRESDVAVREDDDRGEPKRSSEQQGCDLTDARVEGDGGQEAEAKAEAKAQAQAQAKAQAEVNAEAQVEAEVPEAKADAGAAEAAKAEAANAEATNVEADHRQGRKRAVPDESEEVPSSKHPSQPGLSFAASALADAYTIVTGRE